VTIPSDHPNLACAPIHSHNPDDSGSSTTSASLPIDVRAG